MLLFSSFTFSQHFWQCYTRENAPYIIMLHCPLNLSNIRFFYSEADPLNSEKTLIRQGMAKNLRKCPIK